jgi:phage-related protein
MIWSLAGQQRSMVVAVKGLIDSVSAESQFHFKTIMNNGHWHEAYTLTHHLLKKTRKALKSDMIKYWRRVIRPNPWV